MFVCVCVFSKDKCQSKIQRMLKIGCFSFVLLAEKSLKVFDFYVRSIHSAVEGFGGTNDV